MRSLPAFWFGMGMLMLAGTVAAGDQNTSRANIAGAPSSQSAAISPALPPDFDNAAALKTSQAAIGRLLGDYTFRDRQGRLVHLSDYRGKPLVVSLIYTSCAHACPITTRYLQKVIKVAQDALGADSFAVLSIGFDSAHDAPLAMAEFARQQGVNLPHWEFLSMDADSAQRLSRDLGFIYFPTPKGFDHLTQATLIDGQGRIYRQVYGESFDIPLLTEPLKELVSGVQSKHPGIAAISNRIRLFCTVYDPATQSYRVDYSFFVEIGVGGLIVLFVAAFILREVRKNRRSALTLNQG